MTDQANDAAQPQQEAAALDLEATVAATTDDGALLDADPEETHEWHEALEDVIAIDGPARAQFLVQSVVDRAHAAQVKLPRIVTTPYINTIAPEHEAPYAGDEAMERRIRAMLRWNAVMMVSRANKKYQGIGGHISSYASSALLYEVGFNHFFRGPDAEGTGDLVYFQGHASPGIYARAFLEGRLTEENLERFRRETGGGGLSSYPHPWLMPDFWQFPTVSMGLGAIAAIYQARFNRYLQNRGMQDTSQSRIWAFLGDGECDEPETLGALTVAAREGLDNLTFVVNCNLQRLDGPVRGNGKVIQELEGVFRGAGWNVIKVIWGPEWDALFAQDKQGLLAKRVGDIVDGEYQKYTVATGDVIRQSMFGTDPQLLAMVEHLSDDDIKAMRRGGHSATKVFAAFHEATRNPQGPTVILAKTIKGWTLGGGFEASNVTHQMKKLDDTQLRAFRDRLDLPISDDQLHEAPYYHPGKDSPEVEYLLERRRALGGFVPSRRAKKVTLQPPQDTAFSEFYSGSKNNMEASTTMAFVRLLRNLLRDKSIGKNVVPIIPDEARTFGMDPFFREFGIYAPHGQRYTPVDSDMFLSYHEAQNGQLLEEGITEAGAMASFIAAATSHATHALPMIPFYMFYSMFGLQRTGDQVWSAGDARGRGFLLGATAGRTTLHGEGLQHDDGHSHLLANAVPNLMAYDPAYAYESAVIVQDGLRRMLVDNQDVFYYITLYNENYVMPPMPEGCEEGIVRGMYRFKAAPKAKHPVQLFGSGSILNRVLEAQEILAQTYDVAADVWSITSYQQLYRDGRRVERAARLHPDKKPSVPYVTQMLAPTRGPIIAASDWVQELPSLISRFVPRRFVPLGTNGFGRSDTREALRKHFEIDAPSIVVATLHALMLDGVVAAKVVKEAMRSFDIDPDAVDPFEL